MMGRTVMITGIHTGLGHAAAARCLEAGDQVLGLSRNAPDDLAGHQRLRFISHDLRQLSEIPAAVATLLEGVERLDLAILNAGVLGELKDLADTSLEELRAVMDVNLWANKVLLDVLLDGSREVSQVVAISSGAAFNGSGGWGAYSISKSALNLLIRVAAHEHPGTHMTAMAPGIVHTALIDSILDQPDDPRYEAHRRIKAASAEGRIMTTDQAAELLLEKAGEARQHPTGSFLDVRKM